MNPSESNADQLARAAFGARLDHIEPLKYGQIRLDFDNGTRIKIPQFDVVKRPDPVTTEPRTAA